MEELINRTIKKFNETTHVSGQYNVYAAEHRCYILNADVVLKGKFKKLIKGTELVSSFYHQGDKD